MDHPLPRLLRITDHGVWTRTEAEIAFHWVFAATHLLAAGLILLHLGGTIHHAVLALKGLWRR